MNDDAKRYQWLKSQKNLSINPDNGCWKTEKGEKFISPYVLCANGTQYAPGKTLDDIIDAAMEITP